MKNPPEVKNLPDTLAPFVWRYLKNKKIYLAGFFLVALIWAIEMSLTPYLLKIIIDTVDQYSHDQTKMLAFILIPAGVYVMLSIIINFNFRLYDYINLRVYPELKAAVTYDMFAYLMQHSHSFFLNNFAGSLNKRISDMATNIEYVIRIPNDWFYPRIFAMLIASVTLFTVVHPIFGIILFTWATGFIGFSYISARRAEKLSNAMAEALTKMSGTISDSISNVMSTKLFSNIPHELSLVQQNVGNVVNCDRNLLKQNLKVNFVQGIGVTLLLSSMIFALIYGNTQGWITAGDFALVLMLSNWFIFSIFNIGQEMQRFSRIVGICNQALSFIKVPHEIIDTPNALPINIAHGTIKFQNVSFQYLQDQPLFNQLNVTIQAGEKVGLVGYSGGGKTTFIKLLLRLMDIQSGAIMIDGQDIKSVTKSSLRKQISTIPQEPELFHRTIMENIRFARPDATDLEVIEAAQRAKCDEFILQLPQQYQSLVGERGVKLSGGQKQRIAIARAFLKNAPILLLDEATSSLDSVTERYVQESLHNVMLNKTTIVIAHRLSTLKDMTRILVFSHGVIVEDGSLDSLLKDPDGHFYKLWKMQAEGFLPTILE